jgi:hypothetical protein
MRIDLWTKEMPVDEMKIFFHQTLAMSDTFIVPQVMRRCDTMKDFLSILQRNRIEED